MRILFVSYVFSPGVGGIETVARLMAEEFVRAGHEVRVVTQEAARGADAFSYEVARRPGGLKLLKWHLWADVVFHNNVSINFAWPLLFVRRPWVAAHHVWMAEDNRWQGTLKRRSLKFAKNLAVSAAIAERLPVPSEIIGNPYDDELFHAADEHRNRKDLIFAGRLVSDKGVDLLLTALKDIHEAGDQSRLTVVGDGSDKASLEQSAAKLGISDFVTFTGNQKPEKMAVLLREHKVQVVPSRWQEPFGIVALEGLGCGCRLVVADSGGLVEAAGPNAIVFKRGDAGELATALKTALAATNGAADGGEHLRKFKKAAVARRYLDAFEQEIKKHSFKIGVKRWYHKVRSQFRWVWGLIRAYRTFLRILPVAKIPVSSKYFGRPKGYYETADQFANSPAGKSSGSSAREIYPPEKIEYTLPVPLEGGEAHWKFKQEQHKEIPPARVFELPGARFWGCYGGFVISPDDKLLADVSPDVLGLKHHRIRSVVKLPGCATIKGTVAVLSTAEAANNYWHWTFDLLPRLHLLERAGFTPDKVDFYLVNHTGQSFQMETLAAAGIPREKMIQTGARTHIEAGRLVVPSMKPSQYHVSNWTCRFLHGLAPPNGGKPARRLFVGRGATAFRRWINEDEAFRYLQLRGFEKVLTDKLTVAQQRAVFSEAECVVGAHGAAMANIIYCRPETTFVDIFPSGYVDASMWPAASYLRMRHFYILGEGPALDASERKQDIFLSPEKFPLLIPAKN